MNESLNQQVGQRLKEARLQANLSVDQLAGLFKCTPENYRRLEKGVHILTPDKFVLLHEFLNIDPLYLLTGEVREMNNAVSPQETEEAGFQAVRELFHYCRSLVAIE